MKDKNKLKGYVAAIVSATTFGFINLFTVPLLRAGYDPTVILCYRASLASVGLALYMLLARIPFRVKRSDIPFLLLGGCLYFFSAWFLLLGYGYLHSGLATALHFSYPIFVTLLLLMTFGVVPGRRAILSILMAVVGVGCLSLISLKGGEGLNFIGIPVVLLSGLSYSIYIILLRYSRLSRFPGFRVTLYVMMTNAILFGLTSYLKLGEFPILATPMEWTNVILLALIPTIVSNLALVIGVQTIGSSRTSILGALEPVTALMIGILVFAEPFSWGQALGVGLIVASVILVILDRSENSELTSPKDRRILKKQQHV